MFFPVRGLGGFPLMAMALALGIWGFSGRSAMAQGGGVGAGTGGGQPGGGMGRGGASRLGAGNSGRADAMLDSVYGPPAYGYTAVPTGPYGAYSGGAGYTSVVHGPYGIFGPGYPGFGLEYCPRDACRSIHRHFKECSVGNWVAYVSGKECLDPYVAGPYSDPRAFGFWPPYSAPVASVPTLAARGSDLGIDEEPVVDAGGGRGMLVARVYPGTAAAKAGIQPGDVLHAINGYSTQQQGNLAWIIANAAPNHVLEIQLRSVRNGQERTITAQIN